ncbi:peptide-methionine (R)-S-oxide reductase MsrB [Mangrovimonas xylaniphaga]|uniref:peptide-methionine (R)-S-oxide reductase MsrB n=1 Tax=Mangrovimonas xylaniphaga TaxID=1645915 RepID=UPI0006B67E35|nr:peptide-methionine (R)-S-oxide reductase MsrB [Mangrovimonas xylaniphaga]
MNKTEEEWRKILTPDQYHVLREKGTERPYTGEYNLHFEKGAYTCAACGTKLFESTDKFRSDCGWPSFDNAIEGTITYKEDRTHGMVRTEILCSNCGGHLGHVFNDGPTQTGLRYCVNSLSLDFDSAETQKDSTENKLPKN